MGEDLSCRSTRVSLGRFTSIALPSLCSDRAGLAPQSSRRSPRIRLGRTAGCWRGSRRVLDIAGLAVRAIVSARPCHIAAELWRRARPLLLELSSSCWLAQRDPSRLDARFSGTAALPHSSVSIDCLTRVRAPCDLSMKRSDVLAASFPMDARAVLYALRSNPPMRRDWYVCS